MSQEKERELLTTGDVSGAPEWFPQAMADAGWKIVDGVDHTALGLLEESLDPEEMILRSLLLT